MKDKDVQNLTKAFEEMYKYYKGWVFAYEHPGVFAYHQMGGSLSVYFTPDWNQRGQVAIQVTSEDGDVLKAEDVPYSAPAKDGIPYSMAEAYVVFGIVRPYLEANINW